jgi:hypothetical protein
MDNLVNVTMEIVTDPLTKKQKEVAKDKIIRDDMEKLESQNKILTNSIFGKKYYKLPQKTFLKGLVYQRWYNFIHKPSNRNYYICADEKGIRWGLDVDLKKNMNWVVKRNENLKGKLELVSNNEYPNTGVIYSKIKLLKNGQEKEIQVGEVLYNSEPHYLYKNKLYKLLSNVETDIKSSKQFMDEEILLKDSQLKELEKDWEFEMKEYFLKKIKNLRKSLKKSMSKRKKKTPKRTKSKSKSKS